MFLTISVETDLTVVIAFIDYMVLFQPVAVLMWIIWKNKHDYSPLGINSTHGIYVISPCAIGYD